jgi:hypothetical protein
VPGGDFFAAVPAGADAHVLSRVIHDRDDADAVRILRPVAPRCRPTRARWRVLPPRARERPDAIRMDLNMLVLLGARERTEAEQERLHAEATFELRRVIPTRVARQPERDRGRAGGLRRGGSRARRRERRRCGVLAGAAPAGRSRQRRRSVLGWGPAGAGSRVMSDKHGQ